MKRIVLMLCSLICTALFFSSCNKEGTDETWKTIPQEEITKENGDLHFSVNGFESDNGSVQFLAKSATAADVILNGVVPGYDKVTINASLTKYDENSYTFKGETALMDGPSIITLKSTVAPSPIYVVSIYGLIEIGGLVNINIFTSLSEESRGDLVGDWNIDRIAPIVNDAPTEGPVWLTWTFSDGKYSNATAIAQYAGMLLGGMLTDYLNGISLIENGNIAANYWKYNEDEVGDISSLLLRNMPKVDDSGKNYIYGNTHNDQWLTSHASNYVFWCIRNGLFYVIPNIANLSDDEDGDSIDMDSLTQAFVSLAAMGVDIKALKEQITTILKNGIALKYKHDEDTLKLYVDKTMCDPFVNAFIPALPMLDKALEELAKSEDEEDQATVQMIQMVFSALGIEKPSDFKDMWNATKSFQIELNFTM